MNTQITIVWLFPILFMLHDFEEIIMVGIWKDRYVHKLSSMTEASPFAHYQDASSFSFGVLFQFVLYILLTLFGLFTSHYELWFGFFFAVIFHTYLHIKLCLKFKGYVPGIITSLLFTPFSIYLLYLFAQLAHYSLLYSLILMGIGLVLALIMFKWLKNSLYKWHHIVEQYRKPIQ